MGFLTTFLYSQFLVTPAYPTKDFSGQTVIVTGSNVGLGFEAARHFGQLNCSKLILAVRTASKGQAAKESILDSTGRKDDFIEVWDLDLTKTASVKAFVKRAQSLERIDALVENAGISTPKWKVEEGFESTVQVNDICTFLLALLMLPKMRETAKKFDTETHLAIVASEVHHWTTLQEADEADFYAALNDEKRFMATSADR